MSENAITKEMIYEKIEAVRGLNFVDGFDPRCYMRTIEQDNNSPKWYLDVKYRILWFRLCNLKGKISTKIFSHNEKYAVVEAKIYLDYMDPVDNYISSASSQKSVTDSPTYLEWSETAAIGRALTNAGYGIQFCDMLEGTDIQPTESGVDIDKLSVPKNIVQNNTPPVPSKIAANSNVAKAVSPIPANKQVNNQPQNYDEALRMLTIEQCKATKVTFGKHIGKTLNEVAINFPSDLEWYSNRYVGSNFELKAAAKKLLDEALKVAS